MFSSELWMTEMDIPPSLLGDLGACSWEQEYFKRWPHKYCLKVYIYALHLNSIFFSLGWSDIFDDSLSAWQPADSERNPGTAQSGCGCCG